MTAPPERSYVEEARRKNRDALSAGTCGSVAGMGIKSGVRIADKS